MCFSNQLKRYDLSGCSQSCNVTRKYSLKGKPRSPGQQEAARSGSQPAPVPGGLRTVPYRGWWGRLPSLGLFNAGDMDRRICFD